MKRLPWLAFLLPALLLLLVPFSQAAPQTQQELSTAGYLPLVYQPGPPRGTPEPTATALPTATARPLPELGTLGLQLGDVNGTAGVGGSKNVYTVDDVRIISNDEAAATYPNKAQALAAFRAQGRETSYFIRFAEASFFTNPLAISDQVTRYTTADGADAGMTYVLDNQRRQGFVDVVPPPGVVPLGDRMEVLSIVRKQGNTEYQQYLISIRLGRYHTDVQAISFTDFITPQSTYVFAQRAYARLRASIAVSETPPSIMERHTTRPSIPTDMIPIH